jgi:predicted transcriptional regulator
MDDLFCVKTFTKILPAVRSVLSVKMSSEGLTQKDISKIFGITQPAVSQYMNGLRAETAKKMSENKEMSEYLDVLSKDIMARKADIASKTCEICEVARKSGVVEKSEMTPFLCILELSRRKNG